MKLAKVENAGYPKGLLRLEYESPLDGFKDAALILPPRNSALWIVCIHGHGGRENQLFIRKDIKAAWLPTYLRLGCGVLSPNLRGNSWMNKAAMADLDFLLEYIRNSYPVENIIMSSGSMGATSNLIYAAARPDKIDGVIARGAVQDLAEYHHFCTEGASEIPLLGEIAQALEASYGGTPQETPEAYRESSPLFRPEAFLELPMYLVHGAEDELMPVAQSRRFTGALATAKNFVYCELPHGSHNAPLAIPESPGPLDFILSKL